LGTPLKVHYVMTIQKLSMKFIQCDYIIYNIVMLSPFSFELIIFNHMTNYKSQNLAKTTLWQHFMDSVVCFHSWSNGYNKTTHIGGSCSLYGNVTYHCKHVVIATTCNVPTKCWNDDDGFPFSVWIIYTSTFFEFHLEMHNMILLHLEENNYPNQHTFLKCNHEHFVKNLPFFHMNFFLP